VTRSVGQQLGEPNNFDALRFAASSLVIFSHAFPLSYGSTEKLEPLARMSGNQVTFGVLAVDIFFILSGALIAMSFLRSKTLLQFCANRALRLLPGLAGMLILANFVLGPAVTTMPLEEYFLDPEFIDHLANIFMLRPRYALPGVFENLPWPNAISGVLWTLKYEVLCYVMTAILGVIGFLRPYPILVLVGICMVGPFVIDPEHASLYQFMMLFRFFGAGILLYLWRDRITISNSRALTSLSVLVLGCIFGGFEILFVLFGTYLVAFVGLSPLINLVRFGDRGDFSYGIYIYGFPAQQLASYWMGESISWWSNLIIAYPITLVLAYLSWNLVEKRALGWKRYFSPSAPRGDGFAARLVAKLSEASRLRPQGDSYVASRAQ
jgi:peptidoglycan/LPS O-acetylase OafA/YrhL